MVMARSGAPLNLLKPYGNGFPEAWFNSVPLYSVDMKWCVCFILAATVVACHNEDTSTLNTSAVAKASFSSKPAVLIKWVPGRGANPIRDEFEVAVWPDGRMVWRDTKISWAKGASGWSLNRGTYYQGNVDPEAVTALLSEARENGVFSKVWSNRRPDSSYYSVVVRDGKEPARISCWRDGTFAGEDKYDQDVIKQLSLVRAQVSKLQPLKRTRIAKPGLSIQKTWEL